MFVYSYVEVHGSVVRQLELTGSGFLMFPSKEEKSKAFAICWDSHNKGELSKGLSGTRKSQYKALLKNK